jgi:hypothetical protein
MRDKGAACDAIVRALVLVLLHSSLSFAQTWQALVPGMTTEDEVLRVYGKPPNVVIRFVGFDDFEAWQRTGAIARYDFEYFVGGLIQNGPLGEAHKTVVAFGANRRLWQVQWTYLAGLRLHRASGEPPTRVTLAQIEGLLGGNAIIRKVSSQGSQSLSIYRFKKDGSVIEVEYSGEGSDIEVHLSAGGVYPFQ